ncbi:nitrogen fixation protein NifX [Heliorestis acidaminivorans]|uniref:Nitrogen fixation protein NifX n=1 Tax=Heliorestis acidaminivorans TaxID=553427 RepID=A0A6I0ERA3_9FIRM|nr:nitrogen fixation protein NifX [Heliorestis acidaminivorans]KAB2952889.1 nitrogen fixation protein NifX [Heliorestis acidaminivorans]
MRVAFASSNLKSVDAHFGLAESFIIYDVTADKIEQLGVTVCPPGEAGDEDKVESKLNLIKDCSVVYCTQIGGPAAARLVQKSIHPLKVPEGRPIQEELERLQILLATNPPPWLAKKMKKEQKEASAQ